VGGQASGRAQSVNKHNCRQAQAHRVNTYIYIYRPDNCVYMYNNVCKYVHGAHVMQTGPEKAAAAAVE